MILVFNFDHLWEHVETIPLWATKSSACFAGIKILGKCETDYLYLVYNSARIYLEFSNKEPQLTA